MPFKITATLFLFSVLASVQALDAEVNVDGTHPATFIAKVWKEAAASLLPHSKCHVAVAVALAESGGNCQAKNVNTDSHHSVDRGLWQINNYWHKEVSDSCANNCKCNAKAAFTISKKGSNWSPWATYNSGAYKAHYQTAKTACHQEFAASEDEIGPNAGATYNPTAAVKWANSRCNGGSGECPTPGCECAEFVSHALCHGGMFHGSTCLGSSGCNPGTSHYGNCHGHNLRMGTGLYEHLHKNKGWKVKSSAKKGDVVFYTVNGVPKAHTCIAISSSKVDCHNNNHCGAGIDMYPKVILGPPASILSNSTDDADVLV